MDGLTPVPWIAAGDDVLGPPDECFLFNAQNATEVDVRFVALARNAYDVMVRRQWCAYPVLDGWMVLDRSRTVLWRGNKPWEAADPFIALVEADRWYSLQETE